MKVNTFKCVCVCLWWCSCMLDPSQQLNICSLRSCMRQCPVTMTPAAFLLSLQICGEAGLRCARVFFFFCVRPHALAFRPSCLNMRSCTRLTDLPSVRAHPSVSLSHQAECFLVLFRRVFERLCLENEKVNSADAVFAVAFPNMQ